MSSDVHVADRLVAAARAADSLACVGLDPRPALLPPAVRAAALARWGNGAAAVAEAFLQFNLGVLDAVAGHCAAVKPQVACYEAYGSAGWAALEATVRAARERGLQVIVDGKRNDIGSTATHYAQAAFGGAPGLSEEAIPDGTLLDGTLLDGTLLNGMGADWLTINGYLGGDGVSPFLSDERTHGIFVLVRTSNPSAADLQDLLVGTAPYDPESAGVGPLTVAERMAGLVQRWGQGRAGRAGLNDVGAVVGATWPEQARQLRATMPDTMFLVPGYGAQGASAADALAGSRPQGCVGLLINSSRAILGAWQHDDAEDWVGSARRAVQTMNAELAQAAEKAGLSGPAG
ncbi:MAG: orotidine-5'-phosphate decarboxylase [Acidimicrobiales bacterium]